MASSGANDQPPTAKPRVLPEDPKDNTSTTSILTGPLTLSFGGQSSRVRPNTVYRWSHEKNGTLASNVSRIKHSAHPDNKSLKLRKRNAFQAAGTLKPELDFTKERIEKQLDQRKRADPTPFVSTTSDLEYATKKSKHLHAKSRMVPRCLVVTSIDISRLVPATLTADMSTTIDTHDPEHVNVTIRTDTKHYFGIEIPIWVLDNVSYEGDPHNRPDCTVNDVLRAGGMFWFSINELKTSDLRVWAAPKHTNEWLAVGGIPKSIVKQSMPHDGAVLHTSKTTEAIRARGSAEKYFWNHDNNCWDHNPNLKDYRPYRLAQAGDKRFHDDEQATATLISGLIMGHIKRARRSAPEDSSDSGFDSTPDIEDDSESDDST